MKVLIKKSAFVLTIVFFIVSSCKKINQHKPIKVNLYLKNNFSGNPISNAKWIIEQVEESKNYQLNSGKKTLFKDGYTDQNGYAFIEFKRPMSKVYSYYLRMEQYKYPNKIKTNIYDIKLIDKKEQDINILATEERHFYIHLKNENCTGNNDEIYITGGNGEFFHDQIAYINPYLSGCVNMYIDATAYEDNYAYSVTTIKNGVVEEFEKKFTIRKETENDTLIFYY